MEDKDRLSRKLREKERAEEEQYFKKKDAELIAKLRQAKESEQEGTIRELTRSRCPKCGARLHSEDLWGVTVDRCEECAGLWLDPGELEQVVEHDRKTGWLTRYLERIRKKL
jgi:predicted Zn-ribbon and HTH transcriptional regulator